MFHGKQGTGKTTLAMAICEEVLEMHQARVFIVNSSSELHYVTHFIKDVQKDLSSFISIIFFDECEYDMANNESGMKTLLDGNDSLDKCVYLFATNYIEEIPDTIKNRPSRIKYIIEVEGISEEDIVYECISDMNSTLEGSVKLSNREIKRLTPKYAGKTIDEIKNGFIDNCLNINLGKI